MLMLKYISFVTWLSGENGYVSVGSYFSHGRHGKRDFWQIYYWMFAAHFRSWKEDVGDRTNENQKDAIMKCAGFSHMSVPPLLIVGPFGTGKTYTLAQCAKHVLLEPNTRIL